ncbi:MAG TPA: hypothetical protein VHQ65_10945, partial [Thermoanaerobaculia bacterium]|nr:hypothetical protein [Thermoanaerobaculia bacterium]
PDLPEVYEPPAGSWEAAARWRPLLRWFAAGLLLAIPGAFRPFYLVLLVPALLAARAEARTLGEGAGRRLAAFGLGAVLLLAGTSLLQYAAGGDWTSYGGERQGFYERTGFPAVDFPASEWDASVERWGNTSWLFPGAVADYAGSWDWDLGRWNALYFLAGRNVGVLPYFLPLVLAFAAFSPRHGRWVLPLAVLVAAVAFFVVRPFNFYGGTGAIANRYFLPLYPALWFVAARPPRASEVRGRAVLAVVVALAATPFLLPTWRAPRAFPVTEDGRYHHVSALARDWLPYETTQSHLPGGQDFAARGLWVKLLTPGVERLGADRLRLTGEGPAEILFASPEPLTSFAATLGADAPARIPLQGAELRNTVLRPNGGVTLILAPDAPRAVHPMWWTADDWYLYELEIPADAAQGATLTLATSGGG